MSNPTPSRTVKAVHAVRPIAPDPDEDLALAAELRATRSREDLMNLAASHAFGSDPDAVRMRRVVCRALVRSCGHGITVGCGVVMTHPETFEIDDGVFIGDQAIIQGRFDGRCVIGRKTWIGPQSYFDARDLVIGASVGWGPGAKVLGSMHTGLPLDVPIIETDLVVRPVRVGDGADIGMNAVLLPGVTIGAGAIVGAGAVVTHDVKPCSVVIGVPATFLKWRPGYEPGPD